MINKRYTQAFLSPPTRKFILSEIEQQRASNAFLASIYFQYVTPEYSERNARGFSFFLNF
jgi:hypothetical protein